MRSRPSPWTRRRPSSESVGLTRTTDPWANEEDRSPGERSRPCAADCKIASGAAASFGPAQACATSWPQRGPSESATLGFGAIESTNTSEMRPRPGDLTPTLQLTGLTFRSKRTRKSIRTEGRHDPMELMRLEAHFAGAGFDLAMSRLQGVPKYITIPFRAFYNLTLASPMKRAAPFSRGRHRTVMRSITIEFSGFS